MRTKNPETIAAIERFVRKYIEKYGTSPSVQEIADAVGTVKSNAYNYITYMRENGILDHNGGHRGLVIRKEKAANMLRVPVLGAVSCGLPKFAEENIEEYVQLPVALFGSGEYYLLRAKGESMIEAGIDDGDLVLIRQQSYAQEGQIIVALIEDEATLKRFYPENGMIRLHPENARMEDIIVENCIIQGVAVKVLKDLE